MHFKLPRSDITNSKRSKNVNKMRNLRGKNFWRKAESGTFLGYVCDCQAYSNYYDLCISERVADRGKSSLSFISGIQ